VKYLRYSWLDHVQASSKHGLIVKSFVLFNKLSAFVWISVWRQKHFDFQWNICQHNTWGCCFFRLKVSFFSSKASENSIFHCFVTGIFLGVWTWNKLWLRPDCRVQACSHSRDSQAAVHSCKSKVKKHKFHRHSIVCFTFINC